MHYDSATIELLLLGFCFVFYDYRCVHILNTQHGPGPVLGALQTLLTVSNLWCYCYYCHFNEEWYKQTNDISNNILFNLPHVPAW